MNRLVTGFSSIVPTASNTPPDLVQCSLELCVGLLQFTGCFIAREGEGWFKIHAQVETLP